MTSNRNQYQAYAAATQTVAKTKQIVLLYDGAIRFVQQAKEAIRERRIEDRYHLIMRASDIVVGLQACLDFEQGGDIAKLLYQYYASVDSRLFSIHHNNSLETCDAILADLKQMRDVWHEIDEKGTSEADAASMGDQPVSNAPSTPSPVTFSA